MKYNIKKKKHLGRKIYKLMTLIEKRFLIILACISTFYVKIFIKLLIY